MKNKYLIGAAWIIAASFSVVANTTKDQTRTSTEAASNLIGASEIESVTFPAGATTLSIEQKREIRDAIGKTGAKNIEEVQVLVWSDKDYPAAGQEPSEMDIKLADKRGEAIRSYLKDLNVRDVDIHNMAKRPNDIQRFFNTQDAEVKEATENNAANTAIWKVRGGPSKSLVMIVTEKK